jgi:hypothetical protein
MQMEAGGTGRGSKRQTDTERRPSSTPSMVNGSYCAQDDRPVAPPDSARAHTHRAQNGVI